MQHEITELRNQVRTLKRTNVYGFGCLLVAGVVVSLFWLANESQSQTSYADESHRHTSYADESHRHTSYANESHSHSSYVDSNHTHRNLGHIVVESIRVVNPSGKTGVSIMASNNSGGAIQTFDEEEESCILIASHGKRINTRAQGTPLAVRGFIQFMQGDGAVNENGGLRLEMRKDGVGSIISNSISTHKLFVYDDLISKRISVTDNLEVVNETGDVVGFLSSNRAGGGFFSLGYGRTKQNIEMSVFGNTSSLAFTNQSGQKPFDCIHECGRRVYLS